MKKLFSGLFRLAFLVGSVFIGYSIVKKLKEKEYYLEDETLDQEFEESDAEEIVTKKVKERAQKKEMKNTEVKVEKPNVNELKKSKLESIKKIDVSSFTLTFRQQKILNILQVSNIVEMKDLLASVKGVTERTLRRDLLQLQNLGLIKKIGNTKSVKYQLLSK